MTHISDLILEHKQILELKLLEEHNKFIDEIFLKRFNEFPFFIQESFLNSYVKIYGKENLPINNISSLNDNELSLYIRQMDSYYNCLNFYFFHEKMNTYYELSEIKVFFALHKISPLKNGVHTHLIIIRGLLSLIDYQIIFTALKECSLEHYLEEISNLPELKISDSFTDNPTLVKEKIKLMKELINF